MIMAMVMTMMRMMMVRMIDDDDDNGDDDDDPLTPSVWQHSLQASPLERTAMVGDLL